MKKFKQFKSEQQVINEIGPVGVTMMSAMGIFGAGFAAFKLFKKAKETIKGYKETKAEKAENKAAGIVVKIKKWSDEEGKLVDDTVEIAAPNSPEANMSNDEIIKKEKELQAAEKSRNTEKENAYNKAEKAAKDERGGIEDVSDAEAAYENSNKKPEDRKAPAGWRNVGTTQKPQLMTTKDADKEEKRREKVGAPDQKAMQKADDEAEARGELEDEGEKENQRRDKEKKDTEDAEKKKKDDEAAAKKKGEDDAAEKEKEERGGIEDPKDAETFFANNKKAPEGWKDVRTKSEKDKKHKNFKDFKGMILTKADAKKFKEKKKKLGKQPTKKKKPDVKKVGGNSPQVNSKLLNFAEFISEDVMKDLKLATKSRKDSEITLDDGADIPIDPLTASILVKYIEGLGSSEKNKTINKIQRTERAFMKVLGQAHGE